MTLGVPCPVPILQFLGNDGSLLAGGSVLTQVGGVNAATYQDAGLTTPLPNPIPLNSRGEVSSAAGASQQCFLTPGVVYTFTLYDAQGNQVDQAQYVVGTALYAYPQTAAEAAAQVTPVNYAYPPGNVLRYGANSTPGTTDMTTAIQAAINAAGYGNYAVYIPAGTYLISSDITVPLGAQWLQGGSGPFAVDIYGDGAQQSIINFSSSGSFTNGFYLNGNGTIQLAGTIRDIQFNGGETAPVGITFYQTDRARLTDCIVRDFTAQGIYVNSCIATRLETNYVSGCGSASAGCIEIDGVTNNSSITTIDQCYVSSGNSGCIAALRIDRSAGIRVLGGAYESSGIGIQIGGKSTSGQVSTIYIGEGLDIENPGNGNPYIDIGAGLTGGALALNIKIDTVQGFPSSTTTTPYAIQMQNASGVLIERAEFTQSNPTSYIEMVGTNVSGVHVLPHRDLQSLTAPWARFNGTQIKSWGCQLNCVLGPIQNTAPMCTHAGLRAAYSATDVTGATPSILISPTQGGYYGFIGMSNGSATNVSSLSGGEPGMEITIIAADAHSTLVFGNSGGAFRTLSGADLTLSAGMAYCFVNDGASGGAGGSCWVQV